MPRQQNRAHQIAVLGKRARDIAQLVGSAAEVMEQQRRLGMTPVGAARTAPMLRYQLEWRPILDHARLEWPLDARVGRGDRRLGSGPVRGEVGRGRRQSAHRRRVARRQFARRRARRHGQRERGAGCPRDECLGADVCHPTREPSRPAPPWPSNALCCLRRTSSGPIIARRLSGLDAAAPRGRIAPARTSADPRRNNGAPVIAEPPPEGLNVAEYSVSELAVGAQAHARGLLWLHPGARRDLGVQEALLRPLLFRAEGRRRVSRCGVLAHHRAAPVVPARRTGSRSSPPAGHDLSHALQVPADRRSTWRRPGSARSWPCSSSAGSSSRRKGCSTRRASSRCRSCPR